MMAVKNDEKKVTKRPGSVIKRDGYRMPFASYKLKYIFSALGLEDQSDELIWSVINKFGDQETVETAEIYDAVIATLKENNFDDEVESFITKHKVREEEWQKQTDPTERLTRLQKKDPVLVHENANKDSNVFNTQRDLTAGTVGKTLGLRLMPEHVAKAHLRGDIHYHDLDYTPWSPMTNCCLIDFREMLTNGFKIGNAEVESPHSIQTATAQMSQIIANVASSQYGGCSADRVDEVLEPFAMRNYEKHLAESRDYIENPEKQVEFAKKRTKKDIYDAMQALEYEINTLFSSQGQTPFTTLGFGLGTYWISSEIQK